MALLPLFLCRTAQNAQLHRCDLSSALCPLAMGVRIGEVVPGVWICSYGGVGALVRVRGGFPKEGS